MTHLRGHPPAVPVSGLGQTDCFRLVLNSLIPARLQPTNLRPAPWVLRIGGVLGRVALPNYGLEELQGGEGVTSGKHSAM